ncbi:hypothetical protein ACJRO7_005088 [Eucalyptus globulus]|uniref:CLAVATA3/ESR (CLE)-related protein 25 n=1 Tax=Eucalyptus globulus TaxID=34317 RepID=A0ABD3J2Z5_EUCGL
MRKMMRNNNIRASRALYTALAFLGLIWFLSSGIHMSRTAKSATVPLPVPPSVQVSGRTKPLTRDGDPAYRDLNLNFVIRRRVPSGPDPIHNRAVINRQPPAA